MTLLLEISYSQTHQCQCLNIVRMGQISIKSMIPHIIYMLQVIWTLAFFQDKARMSIQTMADEVNHLGTMPLSIVLIASTIILLVSNVFISIFSGS